jgi:hypothetical protein
MSEQAIVSWGEIYGLTNLDLKVWMGETILYHEKVERMLEQ